MLESGSLEEPMPQNRRKTKEYKIRQKTDDKSWMNTLPPIIMDIWRLNTSSRTQFSTSMIMGGRVEGLND